MGRRHLLPTYGKDTVHKGRLRLPQLWAGFLCSPTGHSMNQNCSHACPKMTATLMGREFIHGKGSLMIILNNQTKPLLLFLHFNYNCLHYICYPYGGGSDIWITATI